MLKGDVDILLDEKRLYPPNKDFQTKANVDGEKLYLEAQERERFFEKQASELQWIKKWDKVLEWNPPNAKWFEGGLINVSENCLDRHLNGPNRHKAALIFEGEPGDVRVLTYLQLQMEVCKLANSLKALGIKKGDRVAIYLPQIPEAIISMLACSRIGAIHTVVFAGFSATALEERINDSTAKLLITADGSHRKGAILPLKETVDTALLSCKSIENVIVVKRAGLDIPMILNRDHWYHDLISTASHQCPIVPMNSEDPLFILYTSGTTGKPKGILHTTAGYLLGAHLTTKWVFDVKPDDLYFCTADVGWITGHTYIAYGPLSNGVTQIIYEGAIDYPEKDRLWKIIEKYKVNIFYTAPTAIRTFMKWGKELIESKDLSSLRLLGSVGEPINPEAWVWYMQVIGKGKCPVVDTWWQTETGSIMIAPLPGMSTLKPGSATKPLPGIDVKVLNDKGEECSSGYLAITKPWPSMLRGIWNDPERYIKTYWSKWDGKYYFTGDGAKQDGEGYYWLLGRVDDVMNIAGHRIGTMEVESALVDHQSVAEAAVIGASDEIKGQAIIAFVTLKDKAHLEELSLNGSLEDDLKAHVVEKIGAIARPKRIFFTRDLPKTRSGKIMRRLLRDIGEGRVLGDVTTLADPTILNELKSKYQED